MGKRLFVFYYANMNLGGIQTTIYNYLKIYQNNDIDCVWINEGNAYIDKGYKEALKKVLIWQMPLSADNIAFTKKYNEIVVLTFSFNSFIRCKNALKGVDAKHILLIPHFKNPEVFPEQYFISNSAKKIKDRMKEYYSQLLDNNQLFFFTEKQANALFANYGLDNYEASSRISKKLKCFGEFPDESVLKKQVNNEFNIITVSRLEFPHKGYILGVIDLYSKLKQTYSNMTLTIIGYGDGEKILLDKIRALPQDIKEDVHFIGKVSYEELKKYYDCAKLNIAVAGSVTDGVGFGVPSLVARHYTNDLEVYGFYHTCPDKTTCDDPGNNAEEIVKDFLNASDKEYLRIAKLDYECLKERVNSQSDPYWLFKVPQKDHEIDTNDSLLRKIDKAQRIWTYKYRLHMLFSNPTEFLYKVIKRIGLYKG